MARRRKGAKDEDSSPDEAEESSAVLLRLVFIEGTFYLAAYFWASLCAGAFE
jgi:hypothetical protein